jgi:4-hydroxy-2-oxoglutarate aldolase
LEDGVACASAARERNIHDEEGYQEMKQRTISLAGVFSPIPTPFDAKGDVYHRALTENLARWNEYDLAGYVVLGSNGEAVYLSQEEKVGVWETVRAAVPADKLMLAGTGCESKRETVVMTRLAAQAGADAALVVTPHYYSPMMTAEALVEYYRAVADASAIPILIYNVPKFTNVNMSANAIARAAQHPNIIGVKDTSGNITQLAETVRLAGADLQVLAGSAGFVLAGLVVGAVGGILALANIAPRLSLDIYRLHREGKWDEAAALQRHVIPSNTAITAKYGIAGLKAALDMLGYYGGPVRSPLQELGEDERQALKEVLVAGGVLE